MVNLLPKMQKESDYRVTISKKAYKANQGNDKGLTYGQAPTKFLIPEKLAHPVVSFLHPHGGVKKEIPYIFNSQSILAGIHLAAMSKTKSVDLTGLKKGIYAYY